MKKAITAPNKPATPVEREIRLLLEAAGECGQADLYKAKRRTTRVASALQLEITTDPREPSAVLAATMHNISEGGISFWSKREVALHSSIYVREFSADRERIWVPAVVAHCTKGLRGYLIGAAFDLAADPTAPTPRADSAARARPRAQFRGQTPGRRGAR